MYSFFVNSVDFFQLPETVFQQQKHERNATEASLTLLQLAKLSQKHEQKYQKTNIEVRKCCSPK